MKKVASIVISITIALIIFTGCSKGRVQYDSNLGYAIPGHSYDVNLQCNEGAISFELRNNTKTESGKTVSYNGEVLTSYVFEVEGFDGFLPGWKTFDIENKEGEQFVRLYPVPNDEGKKLKKPINKGLQRG